MPPAVISLNVVVKPWQTCVVPVMDAGREFTVTVVAVVQPVLIV